MAYVFNYTGCVNIAQKKIPDQQNSLTKEWIVTNGIGGYASSTIIGANTRRYHGLLVGAFNPPTGRKVMVSKIEETIISGNNETQLSTNQYPDAVFPEGYHYINKFSRKPFPTTLFKTGNAELLKTVFMVFNSNTTIVEYKNTSAVKYKLRLNPLLATRDYHGLLREQGDYKFFHQSSGNAHSVYAHAGAEPIYFSHTKGTFTESRHWNKNLFYIIEKQRGQDFTEDLFTVGYIEHEMEPDELLYMTFSLDENILNVDPDILKIREEERLIRLVPEKIKNDFLKDLLIAGDQFIVHRKSTENYSIIAGYHWFTDWGRDSMIALRGLCIATGKQKEARSVIITFLNFLNEGIIPNRFADYEKDAPEYHTIDATLWLFIAVYEYDLAFNDKDFLKIVYSQLTEIIEYHLRGTKHKIHVTDKGLLSGGIPELPLTWMDARINNHVFTPRIGCAVEINALWYNALKIHAYITLKLGKKPNETFKAIRYKVENNFEETFWNEKGYLNDVVTEQGVVDSSIRPNQIYVVSLPFSLLPKEKEAEVVDNVREHLLTPFGLRTLNVTHPDFKPFYSGDVWLRDAAYHQGTVWPFLLPEYFFAYLKVNNNSTKAKQEVEKMLHPLKDHFYYNECLHGISEVFDGIDPQTGKGCMHQAWSVSNLVLLLLKHNIDI